MLGRKNSIFIKNLIESYSFKLFYKMDIFWIQKTKANRRSLDTTNDIMFKNWPHGS